MILKLILIRTSLVDEFVENEGVETLLGGLLGGLVGELFGLKHPP